MRKIFLVLLVLVLVICSCSKNSNPIQSAGQQETKILHSDTTIVYSNATNFNISMISSQSDTYKDFSLSTFNLSNATKIKVDFDYFIVANGFYGNNVMLIQNPNNLFLSGNLSQSNFEYSHYSNVSDINPLINGSDIIKLRLVQQYGTIFLAIKNLQILKF